MLSKEVYKERISERIEIKFDTLKPYMDFRCCIFIDFVVYINEVCKCLMMDANTAAITMTNHMLERLLKLALIEDESELIPIPYPPQEHWEKAHAKYNNLVMYKSIDECYEKGLISEEQKIHLNNVIKEQFRNGFSHFDSDKILKDYPYEKEVSPDFILTKAAPGYQMSSTYEFAKNNALPYLDYVVKLLQSIEVNLNNKYPGNLKVIISPGGGVLRVAAKGVNPISGLPNTNGLKKRIKDE